LTAEPSEYFRPLRSVIVYVFPLSVIVGGASARAGMSLPPSWPDLWAYV